MFHWDYVYYRGKIFSGPMRVHFSPNGEAYIMRGKMIHIPNKIPPEGSDLEGEHEGDTVLPLTPGITWYKEAE